MVDNFKYLGSVIYSDGSFDKEILTRISNPRTVFLTSSLYRCDTWTLYRKHICQLEKFYMQSLRSIIDIYWQYRVRNTEALEKSGFTIVGKMILQAQLYWTSLIICMDKSQIPSQLLYDVLLHGKRNWGWPKNKYKDCIKEHLQHCGIAPEALKACISARIYWYTTTKKAISRSGSIRQSCFVNAREKRENTAQNTLIQIFQSPHCTHVCSLCMDLWATHQSTRIEYVQPTIAG